jgi:hypothetical protein
MTTSKQEKLLTFPELDDIFHKYIRMKGSEIYTSYIDDKDLLYIRDFFEHDSKKRNAFTFNKAQVEGILALFKKHVEYILSLKELKDQETGIFKKLEKMKDHEVIELIRKFFE